jgi:hypothetical protein
MRRNTTSPEPARSAHRQSYTSGSRINQVGAFKHFSPPLNQNQVFAAIRHKIHKGLMFPFLRVLRFFAAK